MKFKASRMIQKGVDLNKSFREFKIFLRDYRKGKYRRDQGFFILLRRWKELRKLAYTTDYAYSLGMFDVSVDMNFIKLQAISRKNFTDYQLALNPIQMRPLTEDKILFYKMCQALDIPIPKIHGFFYKDLGLWTNEGVLLNDPREIESFISRLPSDIIIKPALGVYGKGIHAYFKQNGTIKDKNEKNVSPAVLMKEALYGNPFDNLIIQKKLYSHPKLTELSGTDTLQSARVVSLIEKNGHVKIILGFIKPIVGKNIIDNYSAGVTGNLIAYFDLDTSRVVKIIKSKEGGGREAITHHPVTGRKILDFEVPEWDTVKKLIKSIAPKFLPIRSIGWDVAITGEGIFILEGNMFWDPPNESGYVPCIIEVLEKSAENLIGSPAV